MQEKEQIIEQLRAGASYFACGGYLASLDSLHRTEIYHSLGYERLERKNNDINAYFEELNKDWPATFYMMLLRTMGGMDNKEAFTALARVVPYAAILREKGSPQNIEAMLIGSSGLLDLYPHDEYILNLKLNYEYLSTKYSFTPLSASQWKLERIYPNNHPILRLSQITTLLAYTPNIMDRILECRTAKDAHTLFAVETQPYWKEHYTPASANQKTAAKRLGHTKSDLLAINLVAQMQFAYGSYTDSEKLRARALALLEDIKAEANSIITRWKRYGLLACNAFDSQALLQLTFEYCQKERCGECPVGRRVIHTMLNKTM